MIAWAPCIFGMRRLDDILVLGHGVFLLYVSLMFPQQVSHGLKVETTTIMLFNFSMMVLASYLDVSVELSLVLLILYDF